MTPTRFINIDPGKYNIKHLREIETGRERCHCTKNNNTSTIHALYCKYSKFGYAGYACWVILVGFGSLLQFAVVWIISGTSRINQLVLHYPPTCTSLPNSTDVVPLHLVRWLRYYILPIILLSTVGVYYSRQEGRVGSKVSPSNLARYSALRYRKAFIWQEQK
ncbi:hypothetical protein K449DRAFT_217607 [Hypoxylon sp. EC38]|nr:hypothetical protein K449DRAFT_217607 [Hypoxylon sp. EC38]